jgi:hypothetical protein
LGLCLSKEESQAFKYHVNIRPKPDQQAESVSAKISTIKKIKPGRCFDPAKI